jgi:hypothetical protein
MSPADRPIHGPHPQILRRLGRDGLAPSQMKRVPGLYPDGVPTAADNQLRAMERHGSDALC